MKLRTIIVDDEVLARERLKLMLSAEPDLEIIAECQDGDEALQFLKSATPDLLFLDIQMPGLTGLEVARRVGAQRFPPTIFSLHSGSSQSKPSKLRPLTISPSPSR